MTLQCCMVGSAQMFSKSGRRVILSTTGILDVVTFLLVSCRAWDTVVVRGTPWRKTFVHAASP